MSNGIQNCEFKALKNNFFENLEKVYGRKIGPLSTLGGRRRGYRPHVSATAFGAIFRVLGTPWKLFSVLETS